MKNKGFTLIELLVVILIIGILLALIIPNFVLFQERARRSSVKNNMHVIQTVMEAYAVDHFGNYPTADVNDWEDEEDLVYCYFPGGDPVGVEGDPIYGRSPINPYTGQRYNLGDNADLVQSDDELDEPGQAAQLRSEDDACPYADLTPEEEVQGSIFILGYISDYNPMEAVQEYGIAGYGRDMSQPMFDRDPSDEDIFIFFVLHN